MNLAGGLRHQGVEHGIAGEAEDVSVSLSSAQSMASTRP
jgi:hypothetical protein